MSPEEVYSPAVIIINERISNVAKKLHNYPYLASEADVGLLSLLVSLRAGVRKRELNEEET